MTLTTEVDQNEEHHSQPTPNDTEQVPVPFDPSRSKLFILYIAI